MARSLNKVTLIGNLTRDPELRYTPQGNAVCTIGLATNRQWNTDSGEKKEDVEYHRIVAWNKLAEICSQLLVKGRKIYAEGRLQTRNWTAQDGSARSTTEVVLSDMILLDSKGRIESGEDYDVPDSALGDTPQIDEAAEEKQTKSAPKAAANKGKDKPSKEQKPADAADEDIPF